MQGAGGAWVGGKGSVCYRVEMLRTHAHTVQINWGLHPDAMVLKGGRMGFKLGG